MPSVKRRLFCLGLNVLISSVEVGRYHRKTSPGITPWSCKKPIWGLWTDPCIARGIHICEVRIKGLIEDVA